jgi:hypothetical protein
VHTITMELVGSQVHDLLVVLYIGVHKICLAVGHNASHKSTTNHWGRRCEWYIVHVKKLSVCSLWAKDSQFKKHLWTLTLSN